MRVRSLLSLVLVSGLASACARAASSGATNAPTPREGDPSPAVTAEDIQRSPQVSLEDQMAAKFPGVWVARAADGGISVKIRGATSMMGDNEPLYIVDGVAVQLSPIGSLTGIVPNDIESIQVLKDAVATTMYGVRGAHGVILIKTKRADR